MHGDLSAQIYVVALANWAQRRIQHSLKKPPFMSTTHISIKNLTWELGTLVWDLYKKGE
jgi:hypothetical protein